jgi:hypothetical protein
VSRRAGFWHRRLVGVPDNDQRRQDDVMIVSHYAAEDQLECVEALLLLAGFDQHLTPPQPAAIKPPRRRRRRPAEPAA